MKPRSRRLSKRHIFDDVAQREGYDVWQQDNLDDEAAVLFGNTPWRDVEYLRRQAPVLQAVNGFGKKVKPLVRLTEREMAAWCVVRGIDYVVEECPMAVGNKHLSYKDALNLLDNTSPGTKASFYLGFLDRMRPPLNTARRSPPRDHAHVAVTIGNKCRGLRILSACRDDIGS